MLEGQIDVPAQTRLVALRVRPATQHHIRRAYRCRRPEATALYDVFATTSKP